MAVTRADGLGIPASPHDPWARLASLGRRRPPLSRRVLWGLAALLTIVALVLGVALGLNLSGSRYQQVATFDDPAAGISGQRPANWSATGRAGGIAVASPDRSAVVEVAAAGPASQASAVLSGSVAAIDRDYRDAVALSQAVSSVDHLRQHVVVLSARNRAGATLRILVAAGSGRHVAYLLEVFTTTTSPAATIVAAQRIIDSLRLKN